MFIILTMIKGTLRFHQSFEEFHNDCPFLRFNNVQFFSMKLQQLIEIYKDLILFKRHIIKLMSSPIDKCSWCEQYLVNKAKIPKTLLAKFILHFLVSCQSLLEQLKMFYDHQHVEISKLHIVTELKSVLRNIVSILCLIFLVYLIINIHEVP